MKLTIDKKEITALPEDTIMAAARRAGVFIPGMCWSETVKTANCCRLCMVEVTEGNRPRLVAACAFKVREGLEVVTESEQIGRIRRTMLRLLYVQAPDNPAVMELMERYNVRPEPRLPVKDTSQCVLCRLCVENCQALGKSAISAVDRGIAKRIDTPYSEPSEDCIGCASCADVCPTGCIEVKDTVSHRKIWNREFPWVRCGRCGAIITTQAHYEASNPPDAPVLCPTCKKLGAADVFAETLGEGI